MAHTKHRVLKVVGIIVGIVACLALVVVVGLNIYVRTTWSAFYNQAESQFAIPEINSGFIPQDLDHVEADNSWVFSGYMADGSASPLIRRNSDGTVETIYVEMPDGSTYTGHGGGVTSNDDYLFLTSENSYLVIPLDSFVLATDGTKIKVQEEVALDFSPAFINIEDDQLYTGEFYYPSDYETAASHHLTTPDGTENPSVMYAFAEDPENPGLYVHTPDSVFSIPGMVQGTCLDAQGNIVLSTSYGLAASHLLSYNVDLLKPQGTFTVSDGTEVPLYYLDSSNLVNDLANPPMLEGIESFEGKIYTSNEAASNKYIFGKLYNAGEVFAVSLK